MEEATSAGALAVLVDGPLPAGAFSLDVPASVPVVGLDAGVVAEMRAMLAAGIPVTVSIGDVRGRDSRARGVDRGLLLARARVRREPQAEPRRAGRLRADVRARAQRRRRGSVRDDQRDERRCSRHRRRRGGSRTGPSGDRSARAPRAARRIGATRRSRPDRVGRRSRRSARGSPAGGRCRARRVLSFGVAGGERTARSACSASRTSRRARSPCRSGPRAIAPKGVGDHHRSAARSHPAGAQRPRSWFVPTPPTSRPTPGPRRATSCCGSATRPEVHVPWAVAVPADVDLVSRLALKPTGTRISDATPAALSFVAGAVTAAPDPQVRAVELLEVELWRRGTRLGLLARRRELLPGRYTFGLTGRGVTGARLPRGPVRDPARRVSRRRHAEAVGHDRLSRPLVSRRRVIYSAPSSRAREA